MAGNNSDKSTHTFDIIEPDFIYRGQQYVHHSGLDNKNIAFTSVIPKQAGLLSSLAVFLLIALLLNWHATLVAILAVLTAYYIVQILFDLFLAYRSMARPNELEITTAAMKAYGDKWPQYTILCPLYHEEKILPQFVKAMQKLDYPPDELQIILLLEEDDTATVKAVKKMKLGKSFQVEIVPDSLPKTKPKALNYGLKKATGKYVVIYDAEDIPEPKQLKHAVVGFQAADADVACIQSKLDYYNARQNVLTRVFTAEYALWFDLVLPGLQSIRAPIPLGGTSNHFQTKLLKDLGGWDSFNVTEDADLGIRIAKQGFRTLIINSLTYEEASSRYGTWFNQRRRWIKGYIQTYFVHTRRSRDFKSTLRQPNSLLFQMVVGGKIALMFINPIFLLLTILYYCLRSTIGADVESFFPAPVLYPAIISFLFGNFLYIYYYMLGCAKRDHYPLIKFAYLVPIYWLIMGAAAYVALFDFLIHPHYWSKTAHGHHLGAANVEHSALTEVGYGPVAAGEDA